MTSPTGRIAKPFGPNIQNIPIRTEDGRKIKEALTPKVPDTDYSALEQRIKNDIAS